MFWMMFREKIVNILDILDKDVRDEVARKDERRTRRLLAQKIEEAWDMVR